MRARVVHLIAAWVFLAVPNLAAAQTWLKQSPYPTALNFWGVSFFPDGRGFVSTDGRTLYRSLDGGGSWQLVNIPGPPDGPFYVVKVRPSDRVFVLGNNSDQWRSLDAGLTWWQMSTMPSGSWRELDFVSENTAFAGANGALARTVDGGTTWTVRSGYPDCPVIYGMDFLNENVGLVGGTLAQTSTPGIFRTADGGVTWTRTYPQSANDVVYLDANVAIATVGQAIMRSTDGGLSWAQFATGIDTGLFDLEYVGNGLVLGVSGKGDVWRSADGGFSWVRVYRGIGALPASWSIHAASSTEAWAVGASGFILKSTDGGLNWGQMNNGMGEQIYEIEMADSEVGFAAAHNGYIFTTRNGGQRWDITKVEVTGQVFGRDESLHSISVYDRMNVVVAGPGGTVFKTTNGGDTWQNIGYPNLPSLFWIEKALMVDPQTIWVVGLDQDLGHSRAVYKSTNGGQSWILAFQRNSYFFDIDFLDSQRGVLTTIAALYFTTNDGGLNWTQRTLPSYWTNSAPSDVDFADENTGWVVGWYGLIAKTANGGLSHVHQNVGRYDVNFFGVSAVSTSEVWITGRLQDFTPVVYRTTDGGQTWQLVPGGDPQNWLYTIHALPSGDVFGAGYAGIIYRRSSFQLALPTAISTVFGVHISGGVFEASYSDDLRYVVREAPPFALGNPSVNIEVASTSPTATPTSIKLHVETSTSAAPANAVTVRVQMYNYQTGLWELVDTRQSTSTDNAITITPVGSPGRFVQTGTRQMRMRIEWIDPGTLFSFGWVGRVDRVAWEVGLP